VDENRLMVPCDNCGKVKRCNITQGVNDLVFYTCDKCEEKIR